MDIVGKQSIPAPRDAVWQALNDPAVLQRCLPGCQSVERTSPEEFKVVVVATIGPLRAKFNGTLRMTESHPPASCVMVFEGQGGAAGFGQGSARVALHEHGGTTELDYSAQAQVGGKLAQIGSRLVDSVARKMSDDFFKAFLRQFTPQAVAAVAADGPAAAPVAPVAPVEAVAPLAAAKATRPTPASPTLALPASATAGATLVPGWWLAVAALIGSASTVAGALLLR